jgi:hypothetical protein
MVPQSCRPPEAGAVSSLLDRQPFKDQEEHRDQQPSDLERYVGRRQAGISQMAAQGAVRNPGLVGSPLHAHARLICKAGDDEPEDISR